MEPYMNQLQCRLCLNEKIDDKKNLVTITNLLPEYIWPIEKKEVVQLSSCKVYQCPKCNHKSFIFGQLSPQEIIRDYGYKHLGSIPLDYKLAQNDTHLSPQQVSDEIFLTLDKAINNVVE